MVYILVYGAYVICSSTDKSVCWTVCIWCIYLYMVHMSYAAVETSQCVGQCVYDVYMPYIYM